MGLLLEPTALKTAAYTAAYGEMVLADPTGGGFTVTLPRATDHRGELVAVKNCSASVNTITLDGAGSETIDGAATYSMATARLCIWVCSDGTNWIVV